MKLSLSKKEFRHALNSVHRTVATRSTLPVLNNIYLRAEKNEVYLFTTNLECFTEVRISASIEKEGEITLPARLLLDLVNACMASKSEAIFLECENQHSAKIHSGPYNYMINGIDASEYREYLPDFNPAFSFFISGEKLKEMICIARSAVSTDDSKPSMMGAKAEVSADIFRLVATDSRRLAVAQTGLSETVSDEHSFLIPGKALNDVYGLIDDQKPVKILLNDAGNVVTFEIGNLRFFARLLDADFPDYQGFIKDESPLRVKTGVSELREGMEAIMPIARENANIVKLFICDGKLTLEAASPDTGIARIDLFCEKTGGDIEISFNARFLIEALNSVTVKTVELGFSKPLTPCFMKPVGEEQGFIWVIMPIRPA